MTKEDLTKIMELDSKRESIQHLFIDTEVSACSINYLYKNDEEFKKDLYELRNKYEKKYKEEFENIAINYHDGK